MTLGFRPLLIVVGALTALRLLALAMGGIELSEDEAQYWSWAQSLDFGYFSKPPLIAWLIAATTGLFGDGEWAVRLSAPLLHAGTALVLGAIGTRLFDGVVGFWSGVVYATLPAVSLSSALISTDAPLLFCWSVALLALLRGLEEPRLADALLLGTALGLGTLAKYAMLYFLLCAAVACVFVPATRRLLLGRFGLLALALAALLIAPNIAWNAARGFPTFAHTAANANLGGALFHPLALAEFIGSQFGVFGPILFGTLIVGAALLLAGQRKAADAERLCLCFILPVLAVACVIAFLSRANANWAAPAYVAATPFVVHALIGARRRLLFAISLNLHVIALAVVAAVVAEPRLADLAGASNSLKRVRGWAALGAEVALRGTEAPYTAILADEREIMGALLYYATPRRLPVVMWDWHWAPRNHYELARRIDPTTGARVLFVSRIPNPDHVLSRFGSAVALGPITVPVDRVRLRTVYLFDLEGYAPATSVALVSNP